MSVCFEAVLEGQIEEFAKTFPTLVQWKKFIKETRNIAIAEGMDEESFDAMITILTMDGLPEDFAYLRDPEDVRRREEYQKKFRKEIFS